MRKRRKGKEGKKRKKDRCNLASLWSSRELIGNISHPGREVSRYFIIVISVWENFSPLIVRAGRQQHFRPLAELIFKLYS